MRRTIRTCRARKRAHSAAVDCPTLASNPAIEITSMSKNDLAFLMTVAGTICWGICFWWMNRLSKKQNALLAQLKEQGQRIEKLSRIEHDLIKEVHPQVGEIKNGMEKMIAAVKENLPTNHPPQPPDGRA
jgi:hypothetical protein